MTSDGIFTSLSCGALRVEADFDTAVELAAEFGFGAVEPNLRYLRELPESQVGEVGARLAERGLRWGGAGLPVALTGDAVTFGRQLAELEQNAATLRAAGVDRVSTWIRPMSDTVTYRRNFTRHVERIGLVDEVLSASGLRFGLEYVGPKTLWASEHHPFVHTLAEALELFAAVGSANVGVVLDTYHWYTAGESVADLLSLRADQVVAVDLNDAHPGRDRDEQIDQDRTLPGATGVIDVAGFLGALREIGYAGPLKVEPFSKELAGQPARDVVAKTAASLRAVLP